MSQRVRFEEIMKKKVFFVLVSADEPTNEFFRYGVLTLVETKSDGSGLYVMVCLHWQRPKAMEVGCTVMFESYYTEPRPMRIFIGSVHILSVCLLGSVNEPLWLIYIHTSRL